MFTMRHHSIQLYSVQSSDNSRHEPGLETLMYVIVDLQSDRRHYGELTDRLLGKYRPKQQVKCVSVVQYDGVIERRMCYIEHRSWNCPCLHQ